MEPSHRPRWTSVAVAAALVLASSLGTAIAEPTGATEDDARPAAAPAPRLSPLRPIGLGLASLGGAGAIVGLVELIRASTLDEAELAASLPQQPKKGGTAAAPSDLVAPATRGRDATNRRALLFGVSGAVLIGAGVTVYYLGKRAERRPLRLAVSGSGEGGAILLGGRF